MRDPFWEIRELARCTGGTRPCCRVHFPECWACGDESSKLARSGKLVGAFCGPCYRELATGAIPNVIGRRGGGLGAKARLRMLQEQRR